MNRDFQFQWQISPTPEGRYGGHHWPRRFMAEHRDDPCRAIRRHSRGWVRSRHRRDVLLMYLGVIGVVAKNVRKVLTNHLQHGRRWEVQVNRNAEVQQISSVDAAIFYRL